MVIQFEQSLEGSESDKSDDSIVGLVDKPRIIFIYSRPSSQEIKNTLYGYLEIPKWTLFCRQMCSVSSKAHYSLCTDSTQTEHVINNLAFTFDDHLHNNQETAKINIFAKISLIVQH